MSKNHLVEGNLLIEDREEETNEEVEELGKLSLIVEATPLVVTSNFELIKQKLVTYLKKYDIEVDVKDSKSVKAASSLAREINSHIKEFDRSRIDKVKDLSKPIDDFDTKAKELIGYFKNTRQKLLSQVDVFKKAQETKCLALLKEELGFQYSRIGVVARFQNVKVDDLASTLNLNKNGVKKKATDAVLERVLDAKHFQEKIEQRLVNLKIISFEKGLTVPLTEDHVESFLMIDDDALFENKLDSLIGKELNRQNAIARKAVEDAKRNQAISEQMPLPVAKPQEVPPVNQMQKQMTNSDIIEVDPVSYIQGSTGVVEDDEMIEYTLIATFSGLKVKANRFNDVIEAFNKRLAKANFTMMPQIQIVKK